MRMLFRMPASWSSRSRTKRCSPVCSLCIAGPAAGFYPSLHLNLGGCYSMLGDIDRVRNHFERGLAAVAVLGNEGYSRIKGGLDRLAERLTSV